VWISPRRVSYDGFNYDSQTEWESIGLRIADIILFWIPAPVEDIAGRGYAQTTRIEFSENIGRHNKPLVTGIYPDYNGRQYFINKSQEYRNEPIYETLDECLDKIRELVAEKRRKKLFFTSDTHFSSERALELSKRPFFSVHDMDWTMIDRWNSVVGPNDTVYHLGDFGDSWPLGYLNGKITFIRGNYERDGKSPMPDKVKMLENPDTAVLYKNDKPWLLLAHEPTLALKTKEENPEFKDVPVLFGHIHGRQKVKEWCGLDVGVDAFNYTPAS
jgi:calcineurin-like phosphoesterase family protein